MDQVVMRRMKEEDIENVKALIKVCKDLSKLNILLSVGRFLFL